MTARLYCGDALDVLRALPDGAARCCVTSPPYWGLRDYGVPGQLGLERTPEEYVARLVEVFREVRRVLTDDGTVFLNLGDSYNSVGHKKSGSGYGTTGLAGGIAQEHTPLRRENSAPGLKHKDLVGIPWMVAFALRADGWYLRSDIIWAKPNPMPESVTDRPTKAHEYVFLLSKGSRYFYDAAAIAEPSIWFGQDPRSGQGNIRYSGGKRDGASGNGQEAFATIAPTRNARTVWEIATQSYPGAHFATFPEELARRCIVAGTSAKGHCPECGAPWVRTTERVDQGYDGSRYGERVVEASGGAKTGGTARSTLGSTNGRLVGQSITVGWAPTCEHGQAPEPDVVLDPFGGSGTVAQVATGNGRSAIHIDLNPTYIELARDRIGPMLCEVA
jgi:DNA modification methylase